MIDLSARNARIATGASTLALLFVAASAIAADEADWPSFANDKGGSQYSSLTDIDRDNVGQLEPAWTHQSGDFIEGKTSLQVTPIHVDGRLYYCTPLNRVFALDPATGEELWVFSPHASSGDDAPLVDAEPPAAPCRGVAFWEGPDDGASCSKRIFKSDALGNIYAIDAGTGRSCTDFGEQYGHPGYVTHHDFEGYGEGGRGMTSPPLVLGNVVVAGSGSNDGLTNAVDGVVRAFDVRTGELQWTFNPIPPDFTDKTGAANVWSTMSGDPDSGLVFVPTTSPSTDYFGGLRQFPIPLSDAIVALEVESGEVAWSFQTVRHDLFDYDLPGHALLVTIRKDGALRKVAIQQTKMGHLFVFDRTTGNPVFPIEDIEVPATDLPDDKAAPTQPVPRGVDSFARQTLDRESMFGVTPLDRGWCRRAFDELRYEGLFTPPGDQETILFPSALGGGNWGGAAFDPDRNLLVIKAENLATRLKLARQTPEDTLEAPVDYLTRPLQGTPYRSEGELFMSPLGIPCTPPPWGTLTAIDMDSGKTRWQIPLGQIRQFGITIPASWGWGSPNIAGPILTASGLVFVAGTLDRKIRALDVDSGEELWQADLPVAATALPMTYRSNGRQYVVIAAGGTPRAGTRSGDVIRAFALPE